MVKMELAFGLLTLALWIYCLVEVISSDEGGIRHLPKVPWLLIVLFFPLAGSIAWLVAGRPVGQAPPRAFERAAPAFPEYDRPGRAAATTPEGDDEFLRRVRERAEEQRRSHEQRRKQQQTEGDEAGEQA